LPTQSTDITTLWIAPVRANRGRLQRYGLQPQSSIHDKVRWQAVAAVEAPRLAINCASMKWQERDGIVVDLLQYVPSYSQSLRWVFVPARPPSMMTIDKPSGTTRACPHFGITHPHIHPSNTRSHPAKQSLHSLGPRSRNHHVTDDRGPRAAVW